MSNGIALIKWQSIITIYTGEYGIVKHEMAESSETVQREVK